MAIFSTMEDLLDQLQKLPVMNSEAEQAAGRRQGQLTKPVGSLGRLEEIAIWLAGWQGRERPRLDHCQTLVFAGNHGIAARGVSAFPATVTAAMVANFAAGGAAINQLCDAVDATLDIRAIDLDRPTLDFTEAPALGWEDCLTAINLGADAVDREADIVLLGEMGIGNTTVAAALCAGLFGGDPIDWVGAGSGVDAATVARKAALIGRAIALHGDSLSTPLGVLSCLGGRELAAIFGAVVEARRHRIPVILDGFVCTAAAAPLARLASDGLDHCLVAHRSAEAGHARLLQAIEKAALLDLDMRLGEASGAALGLALLRCAVAAHNGMATFEEAGVAGKSA
jgi:nicotinate-nucleotide--dimethylbenzimidazole phosphoribosyltransferase